MSERREIWLAKNISSKTFSLGDLPLAPTFSPGDGYNLLDFYPIEQLLQSKTLVTVIRNGWLRLTKTRDGVSEVVSAEGPESQLAVPDVQDVDEAAEVEPHGHVIADVDGLDEALATKASLSAATFTGPVVLRMLGDISTGGTAGEVARFGNSFYGFNGSRWVRLGAVYTGTVL